MIPLDMTALPHSHLIPILSAQQVREWDQYTIHTRQISSYQLMERAVTAVASWITTRYAPEEWHVVVICGPGNNGGDGLGLARQLFKQFYDVTVWLVGDSKTVDHQTNLDRLPTSEGMRLVRWPDSLPPSDRTTSPIYVDALFGTGLKGPVSGIHAEVIAQVNARQGLKIAIDLPSGLLADEPTTGPCVEAEHTLTFQVPKLAFFIRENERFVGQWHALDIGLAPAYPDDLPKQISLLTIPYIRDILPPRSTFAHKGTMGHACLICGSDGMMGAALLSGQAALRSGTGKLTIHAPRHGQLIIQIGLPEAIYDADPHDQVWSRVIDTTRYQSVGIGCGIGTNEITHQALKGWLSSKPEQPLVLDADAINLLSSHPDDLHLLPSGCILTPHGGEFNRLVGGAPDSWSQLTNAMVFARTHRVFLVLKGAYTRIITPQGDVLINSTGNAGMATAGSGDVLAGLMTGLLAQGLSPLHACCIGVMIHGLAGDLAVDRRGSQEALLASDIIDHLGHAFQAVHQSTDR